MTDVRWSVPRLALALLGVVVAVGLVYGLAWPTSSDFASTLDRCPLLFCDFAEVYYPMGEEVRRALGPVPGYYYTPTFAVFLGVLGASPFATAVVAWGVLLAVSALAFLVLPLGLLEHGRGPLAVAYGALLVTAHPVLHELAWGQVGTATLALVLVALLADGRGRGAIAGAALALAIAVKFYAGIFGVWFLVRRRWAAAGWCALWTGILLLVLPVLALGWTEAWAFWAEVGHRLRIDGPSNTINSQFAPRVVARWLLAGAHPDGIFALAPDEGMESELHAFGPGAVLAMRGVTLLVLAASARVALLYARRLGDRAALPVFAIVACTIPFLVRTSWPHYFTFLPLCQVVVVDVWLRGRSRQPRALGALALTALSIGLSSVGFFALQGDWRSMGFFGWLLVADVAVLGALLLSVPPPSAVGVQR